MCVYINSATSTDTTYCSRWITTANLPLPEGFKLRQPLTIKAEHWKPKEWTVTAPTLGVWGIGETYELALKDLGVSIIDLYHSLCPHEDRLGISLLLCLELLREILQPPQP